MPQLLTLDVRHQPRGRRHELIFDSFSALPQDEAFVLVNDHDPKPLQSQFESKHAGQFTWEYLERGPEVWRVQIGRRRPVSPALPEMHECQRGST
jgi:uncharacterized protein (DUF2249 family)